MVGAFGEISDDVKELANAVAEELAVEHCSFYRDETSKAVKGFFLNQLYRSWGNIAHSGWARLLLDRRDGFEAELNSYGQGGRALGPVVGAFGEMSDDVKELANAVAEELAVEHCSFYGDKTSKAVKGFFLYQVYRSWRHTAHRGWARLLLDRRSLVQVSQCPTPSGTRRR